MTGELIPIHPDSIYGEEAASEKAGEEVWLDAYSKTRESGNLTLAQQIFEQQFQKDGEGNIFVIINGERKILGHISLGYKLLISRPDWPRVRR